MQITTISDEELKGLMLKYSYAKQMLETEIDILVKDFEFHHGYNPVEHVKGRIKSEKSVRDKLTRLNKEFNVKNIEKYITDMVGIRIVCSFLSDVFDIVSFLNHSKNIIVKERQDYIREPKDTGYMSYHLIVLVPIYLTQRVEYIGCEIQIRTMAMDFWASLDHKISYKFQSSIPDEVKSQMYDYAQIIKDLDKKMLELNETVSRYKKNL